MFKTFLNLFGNLFGLFEEKWKFFHFSDLFPSFDPPGCTGQNFFPEKYLKTSSTLVWKLLRTFLDTFRNSIFFDFFRISASFDLQGALVKKSSEKFTSEEIWTLLETFSGFWKIEFFCIFWNFSISLPSRVHWAIFFTGKNTSKHVENKFEHFWERIWAFWKLKAFQFFEFFPSLDLPGCTGQFFPRKLPQNKFKICLDTFRTVFGHFWNFKFCRFFFEFFQVSTVQGALVNFLTKKTTSKHVQNVFETFWEFIWAFWRKMKVFPFFWPFSKFRPSRVHWAKFFSRKIPQNNFNTCLKNF